MASGRFERTMVTKGSRRSALRTALVLAPLALLLGSAPGALAQEAFDHWATGFPLDGAHARTACEDCHRGGLFEGTPKDCATCHGWTGLFARSRKPLNHVPSSNRCDDCHTRTSWANARFEHTGVEGPCATCHGGVWAEGKPASHLPTSNRCEDCHMALTWRNARFDHVGIASGCFACHNGVQATGKPGDHLPTSSRCEDCHETTRFRPAHFSHVGIASGCVGCHNNVLVPGKPAGHIPAPDTCELCHQTTSWR